MNVPFLDLSMQYEEIKDEIAVGIEKVFKKGDFILGQAVKDFECDYAKYCEAQYGVGVNSGTDALYLALRALGVKSGDEVIVPSFTFIATALCASYTGAKVVFADIESTTYNMDPAKLEALITKNTKVIIPVHLYGQPANIQEICEIAKEHNIKVIEDACQAHGSSYKGKRIGSLGDIGCFSFYPTKSLGACGDGGMIITSDKEIYDRACMLRDYGRKDRYNHSVKGYNSRLDTLQAVILSAKLKRLDKWNAMRNNLAKHYIELLSKIPGIKAPVTREDRTHVYQTFAIRIKNRDKVIDSLQEKGVRALIHYPIPLHLQEAYKDLGYKSGDLPESESLASDILSLPMFPHMSEEQVECVCGALKSVTQ